MDIEQIQYLVGLHLKAEKSPTGNIAKALAKAKSEFKPLHKNAEVTVKTRSGGSYGFKYADLTAIFEATSEALSKHGIAAVHTIRGEKLELKLLHESGEKIISSVPLPAMNNDIQAYGSALTYLKRYTLSAALGLAADDDDDGNLSMGNEAQKKRIERAKPKTPTTKPEIIKSIQDWLASKNKEEKGMIAWYYTNFDKPAHDSINDMTVAELNMLMTSLKTNTPLEKTNEA